MIGVLKKRTKTFRGREWSSLFVRSLYEKNCLVFQTAKRLLSDKSLSSCYKVCCFEPSSADKCVFILKSRRHFFSCNVFYDEQGGKEGSKFGNFKQTYFLSAPLQLGAFLNITPLRRCSLRFAIKHMVLNLETHQIKKIFRKQNVP